MKHILFSVSQVSDSYDKAALQKAINNAQPKIDQLGLMEFDKVELSLVSGPTEIEFSVQELAEETTIPTAADAVE